ncbi:hypothetical protein [Streptomyces afghaniensis]|uniref:hypothetical protein n=1 Tax=Streptomyces afghaniensis TaxID=66865 RepID=UPI0031454CF4
MTGTREPVRPPRPDRPSGPAAAGRGVGGLGVGLWLLEAGQLLGGRGRALGAGLAAEEVLEPGGRLLASAGHRCDVLRRLGVRVRGGRQRPGPQEPRRLGVLLGGHLGRQRTRAHRGYVLRRPLVGGGGRDRRQILRRPLVGGRGQGCTSGSGTVSAGGRLLRATCGG